MHRPGWLAICVAAAVVSTPATAEILFEIYNSRPAFEARLNGDVSVIDFDDVDTSGIDPRQFSANRYEATTGAIITGATAEGQYTSRSFNDPAGFPPTSSPNVYAPGPISVVVGTNTTTVVTFRLGAFPGFVAGFGAVFIDADFPLLGASTLSVFDADDIQLATTGTISGTNASQLFRGIVAVDGDTDTPIRLIAMAELVSGNSWPTVETFDSEGVVLDDFVFQTVPEPSTRLGATAALLAATALGARRRR